MEWLVVLYDYSSTLRAKSSLITQYDNRSTLKSTCGTKYTKNSLFSLFVAYFVPKCGANGWIFSKSGINGRYVWNNWHMPSQISYQSFHFNTFHVCTWYWHNTATTGHFSIIFRNFRCSHPHTLYEPILPPFRTFPQPFVPHFHQLIPQNSKKWKIWYHNRLSTHQRSAY